LNQPVLKTGFPLVFEIHSLWHIAVEVFGLEVSSWNSRETLYEKTRSQATGGDHNEKELWQKYEQTCVGGTFDNLHSGHRLLLTQAVFMTSKTLHVGITGDKLMDELTGYDEQDYKVRAIDVLKFCLNLNPHLKVEIYLLDDRIGIVGNSMDIQACILTKETKEGGDEINEERKKNNLEPI
jgi:phosphopantetheine adenylyltransferase